MAGVGERLVTGGNGRGHQVGKYCYLWLWKVFGFVISVGSGQLAKALKSGFLLGGKTLPAHLPASLQFIILT